MRETDASDTVAGFALDSGVLSNPDAANPAHSPLPAEAHAQAQAQTQDMHRLYSLGQHNEAFQAGRQALALWHALQEHARSCEVLCLLSATCMEHEQGVEALALARHALRLARVRVLPLALVQSLAVLGALHGHLHDVSVGENLALQALSRARELHNRPMLMQTLEALLSVLLEAHEVQRLAGDATSMQATAQRMLRHANHALAQSGALPDNFIDLQLRTQAASALVVGGRPTDALPVLTQCIELARQAGYANVSLWARLYGAQASMLLGNDSAAWAEAQMLGPMLSADHPPRLRLAHLSLQALLAERMGAQDAADQHRAAAHALRDTLLRQRLKLRATLRRNSDDVQQALATLDREWLERDAPPPAAANAAAAPVAEEPSASSNPPTGGDGTDANSQASQDARDGTGTPPA